MIKTSKDSKQPLNKSVCTVGRMNRKLSENWKTLETAVSQVIAKAWINEECRKRFVSAPGAILPEAKGL
ncbi:MAG: hypothetical protein F6K56_14310 [Moorea sp. SIO3G5]|nr:hypothetical protein [Moorena sp. SIO3G5]